MSDHNISDEHVSSLIDKILTAKDPATVGLRKIIRRKNEENKDFPLKSVTFEEFSTPEKTKKILTDDERRILELEKKIADFNILLKKQQDLTKVQSEAAYSKGKKEGFDAGVIKGKEEAVSIYSKNLEEIRKQVASFLKNVEDSKREIFSNTEHILAKLCVEMTRKIISNEILTSHDFIVNVLKKALTYIADRERLVIRVAKADFEIVNANRDFWNPVAERLKEITIEKDERIERGGCIIESNTGIVDARLGVLMEEMFGLIEKTWETERMTMEKS